jgi:RimJ/RimL family protein N-acetyltransferase
MIQLRCNNLVFRRPTSNDIDELVALKNNEKAVYLLGGAFHLYTHEDIEHWVAFHNSNKEEVLLVVYDETADRLIGHVGLYKIDNVAKKTEYGILIADDNSRGKGYGTMCTKTMVDYAFDVLGMHKVTAEVLTENKASEAMFKKCGFSIDGILRDDCFKNNRYYDVFSMSVLKEERI